VKPAQDAGAPSNRGVNFTSSVPDITNHLATIFWLLSGMASCFISGLPAFGFLHSAKIFVGNAR
jgi:hypothetical protein